MTARRSSVPISATVNRVRTERVVEPRVTLAEFLRDHLGLTGTKLSCGLQVCGVCTVLVDGRPVSACSYLAVDIDGTDVLTVEGLAREGEPHPLQQAFVERFALQCGYCTPGFLLMAKALLDQNPSATRDEIVEYLEGNICRCTGYQTIVDAVELAARRLAEARDV